jgi:hypothetical protein
MRTLVTLGLGALAMYLLDPQQGRRRRALLRDQVTHARRAGGERARPIKSELEPDAPSETPQGAQHLGR